MVTKSAGITNLPIIHMYALHNTHAESRLTITKTDNCKVFKSTYEMLSMHLLHACKIHAAFHYENWHINLILLVAMSLRFTACLCSTCSSQQAMPHVLIRWHWHDSSVLYKATKANKPAFTIYSKSEPGCTSTIILHLFIGCTV